MSRSFTNHGSSPSTAATCGMFAAAIATFCSTAPSAMSACASHARLVAGRPIVCVASHAHFDHIGSHHEFEDRRVEVSEAAILADPRREWTLADRYATDQMFDRLPPGWDAAAYRIRPAPATRPAPGHGDRIDLGDRAFDVIHTPGHSPGGIALFEAKTGILLSGRCNL